MSGWAPRALRYPGPIAKAWAEDFVTPISNIMGPAGSGKTTTAVFKGPLFVTGLMPVCRDGVIRGRITVIRDNYRRMAETTLKSWKLTFNEDLPYSDFEGGQDRPVHHRMEKEVLRGAMVWRGPPPENPTTRKLLEAVHRAFPVQKRICIVEVDFFSVGDHRIEELLRGYETSIGWGNEADLLNDRVMPFLFSRTARFPSKTMLPDEILELIQREDWKMPRQVFGDLNPPDTEHWAVKWVEEGRKGYKLYRQPSGLAPNAENRAGKSKAEYEDELGTLDEYDAQRFVHGEPGFARDGFPVYAVPKDGIGGFRRHEHVADGPLKIFPEIPINAGFDAGGTPAGMFIQRLPSGRINFLREITTEPVTGSERFGAMCRDLLTTDFRGVPVALCFGDPSAFYGADKEVGELAWMETVALAIGHNIVPAPSQEPGIRIASIATLLKESGMVQIDPSCRMFIGGLAAHYKLGKDARGNVVGEDKTRVVKNAHSHIVEAAQYVTLGVRGKAGVIEDSARAGRPGNVIPIISGNRPRSDFDVWSV